MRRFVSADGLDPRPRRRRLRSLSFLPTLITLGNLVCGFAAIHFAMRELYEFSAGVSPEHIRTIQLGPKIFERMLPSFLSLGALLIFVGMFLDAFDGLIARVTRSTTTFGGQLDSLADVISFGIAPAIAPDAPAHRRPQWTAAPGRSWRPTWPEAGSPTWSSPTARPASATRSPRGPSPPRTACIGSSRAPQGRDPGLRPRGASPGPPRPTYTPRR